ncbi:MAG: Fe-S cluster assembly ATPase SufC [Acidimicrobiales bacterium]
MADAPLFEMDHLHASTPSTAEGSGVEVLSGASLTVNHGEVHALIGPAGSGTSSLAAVLLGSARSEVTAGRILFRGDDITHWGTDVRAKAGLFLAFGEPQELPGVSLLNFLHRALSTRSGLEMSITQLRASLLGWMERLGIDPALLERHINDGFSADDRKRSELLQMAVLEPEMAILDEMASGLDDAAMGTVATGLRAIRNERPSLGTLAITSHPRFLDHLQPDHVHVLVDGRIVASGGSELAAHLERNGNESHR